MIIIECIAVTINFLTLKKKAVRGSDNMTGALRVHTTTTTTTTTYPSLQQSRHPTKNSLCLSNGCYSTYSILLCLVRGNVRAIIVRSINVIAKKIMEHPNSRLLNAFWTFSFESINDYVKIPPPSF